MDAVLLLRDAVRVQSVELERVEAICGCKFRLLSRVRSA